MLDARSDAADAGRLAPSPRWSPHPLEPLRRSAGTTLGARRQCAEERREGDTIHAPAYDCHATRFEVFNTTIKKWSVGSPLQSVLDSVTVLLDDPAVRAGNIKRIAVDIPTESLRIVDNSTIPDLCLQQAEERDALVARTVNLRSWGR